MVPSNYPKFLMALLAISVIYLAGCGSRVNLAASDNPDEITPPAAPGTQEQLLGKTWVFQGLDMTVTFYGESGNATDPVIDQNAQWRPR